MLTLSLLLLACGTPGGRFRLEGRFRSLNQGELYIYSLQSPSRKLDTIRVANGRFSYEVAMEEPTTLCLLFPNYSEVPVFAESGATVELEADASHLKEAGLTGTDANEAMTKFRMNANQLAPPAAAKAAADYVRQHPQSPVSLYLVNKYFVLAEEPDYRLAGELTALMLKGTPDNPQLQQLNKQLHALQASAPKARLPHFAAIDTKGRHVSDGNLKSELNVVSVWADWHNNSKDMQRKLYRLKKQYGNRLAVVSICLDPNVQDCRKTLERDSVTWPTVCDGTMWQTPLLDKLGLAHVPDNIVADRNGRILATNLSPNNLKEEIEKRLK